MMLGDEIVPVILAFVRIASFLFFIPLMQGSAIPSMAKVALAAGLSLAVVGEYEVAPIKTEMAFIGYVFVQVVIGLVLAKLVEFLMSIPKMAGSLMDIDMAFSQSSIFDPSSNQQSTPISIALNFMFLLMFLTLGGIQQLIITLIHSFKLTETLRFLEKEEFLDYVLGLVMYMMTASVQIALPVMGSMFIVNIVLMIIGRMVSSMQSGVFQNMFPIKITMGLLFLIAAIPIIGDIFVVLTERIIDEYVASFEYLFKK